MAVGGQIVPAVIVGPRFGIEQDGRQHRLHIAPHPVAVLGEDRRDTLHVGRTRIALHQMLDQQLADKRPDIRMVENVVQRVAQILLRAQAGRIE